MLKSPKSFANCKNCVKDLSVSKQKNGLHKDIMAHGNVGNTLTCSNSSKFRFWNNNREKIYIRYLNITSQLVKSDGLCKYYEWSHLNKCDQTLTSSSASASASFSFLTEFTAILGSGHVTEFKLTPNESPEFRSRDHNWPMRGPYSSPVILPDSRPRVREGELHQAEGNVAEVLRHVDQWVQAERHPHWGEREKMRMNHLCRDILRVFLLFRLIGTFPRIGFYLQRKPETHNK